MSKEHDGIFQALAHRVRRSIIRVLAEKGPRSFTELMKDVGIDDSSVMAFHIKKLGSLVRKNEKGYYELTDLGWKAYRFLRELEIESVSDELSKVIESKAREAREEVELGNEITVANALEYRITRELIEKLAREGKKLNLKNIVLLIVDRDVDPEKLKKVIGRVSNVLEIDAPREIRELLGESMRVPEVGFAIRALLRSLIPAIVRPLVSIAKGGATKVIFRKPISASIDSPEPTLIIDVTGCDIELRRSGKGVFFEGEGGSEAYVKIDKSDGSVIVKALEVDGVLYIDEVREKLVMNVKGGDVRGEIAIPKISELKVVGGDLEIKAKVKELSELKIIVHGGDAFLEMDIDSVPEVARVSIDVVGGDADLKMIIPRDVRIELESVKTMGGDYVLNIPEIEKGDKKISLNIKVVGGDARVDVAMK